MKILVTGGAGFIGSAVVQKFQSEDHDVAIIDDLSFGNREFVTVTQDNFYECDILDSQRVDEVFHHYHPEVVIHLAAVHFIPWCNKHPYESSQINITGTINILRACDIHQVKKVIFASTAAVYPINEEATNEFFPVGPMDIYGLSKLVGEHLCNEFHLRTSTPVVICRFFNAFGPNETNPHLIPEIQKQVNSGLRKIKLGNTEPKRDFIHTSDISNAIFMLVLTHLSGIETYNIGQGVEYSVVDIVESFSRVIGEPIEIETDPERVRKVERMHLLADTTKLRSLGWKPLIDIDSGIKTLVTL
ncbi:NAD-dependent epimerase/dehydratase family protein [Armatimonas sp.]|uniref:NAD-dependent epimerase/dehydratase family protein n=1 Tax=Armatimonas sp. TaxID=1872638 RepID=UPI0037501409